MKLNQPITNGTNGATSEFLREMADMEHEETRVLEAMVSDSAIHRYEEVRDNGRFAKVKRLNTHMLKEMTQIERRLLRDWIDAQVKELESKSGLISRHLNDAEPDLPNYLREQGAA